MNRIRSIVISVTLLSFSTVAVPDENPYPPVQFFATFSKDKLLEELRDVKQFENIDNDATGSAIVISVQHQSRMTAGGTAAAMGSAVLAGGTLGLLPVISNDDLVITYIVSVHGDRIASFEYIENFTDADSIYGNNLHALEGPALEWAESTVGTFLSEVSAHPEVQALVDEYRYYFLTSPVVADNVED